MTIEVQPASAVVAQLQSVQLEVATLDADGDTVPGAVYSFASSHPDIVTVSPTGRVTSVGPAGTGSITVTSGSLTTNVQVAVTQVATSIELLPNPLSLPPGATVPLGARVLDAVGTRMAGAPVTYTVAPTSLLSVSVEGQLTAGPGTGQGTATVTSGSVSQTVPVSIVHVATLGGQIIATAPLNTAPYVALIAPDNTVYGMGTGGSLNIGTFGTTGMQPQPLSGAVTIGIARHPASGRLFVSGAGADALMEVNQNTFAVMRRWAAPGVQMYDVVISPDGKQVYVGGDDGALYVIDVHTMTKVAEHHTARTIVHLVAHPSRPFVYASGFERTREINLETGAVRVFTLASGQAAALSLSGERLYIGSEAGAISTVTLATGTQTTTPVACGIYDLVTAPDGRTLLATCEGGAAVLYDAETLAIRSTIPTGGTPRRAFITPDGASAVIANNNGWYDHVR